MDIVQIIRNASKFEEIDYPFLLHLLKGYVHPRDKITWLLRKSVLLRVKKGIYIFGPEYSRSPYSMEVLANLLYGPSYISMEYALSFYGLIPERVERVTSVTSKRDKEFTTAVGIFKYRYLHSQKYFVGVSHHAIDEVRRILIATPEKALADLIALSRSGLNLSENRDVQAFLYDDLRMDDKFVFDKKRMSEIAAAYRNPDVEQVHRWISEKEGR